nr:MAG TPA: hypothetical protein [Caudoviricetes sp.]DAS79916.1 MAG TPA: hypothetical protein [Caudoviricetes sp.]
MVALIIIAFPLVVLWEVMKMNENTHHRGKRRKRK